MNLDTLSNAALIVSSSASLVLSFISLLLAKRLFKKDAPVGQKRSQYVGAKVQEEKANEKICLIRKKDSWTNDELEKLIKLQENGMSNFRSELKKQNINHWSKAWIRLLVLSQSITKYGFLFSW